jgi:hypothetical protein
MASPPAIQVESSAPPGRVAPNSQGPRAVKEWLEAAHDEAVSSTPFYFFIPSRRILCEEQAKKMANNGSDAKMAN